MARILIVEDDPDAELIMERVLRKMGGHQTTVTEDPEEALKLCRAGEVDLVLMDVSLQRSSYQGKPVDGLEITRLLKSDDRTAHLPVLLVTAHAMRGDRERFLEASGADGYVTKPIADYDRFLKTVNGLLSRGETSDRRPEPPVSGPQSPVFSHEAGKLLFSVKGALTLMGERADALEPSLRELLAIAERGVNRLISLLTGTVTGVIRPGPGFDPTQLLASLEKRADGVRKILVADDEPDVVRVLTSLLEARGYEVIQAFDGKEALEQAAREKPDLILLDLDMPGMDGYEVLFYLKRDERLKQIPVIVFTGCTWGEEQAARGFGADGFLSKRSRPEASGDG